MNKARKGVFNGKRMNENVVIIDNTFDNPLFDYVGVDITKATLELLEYFLHTELKKRNSCRSTLES